MNTPVTVATASLRSSGASLVAGFRRLARLGSGALECQGLAGVGVGGIWGLRL